MAKSMSSLRFISQVTDMKPADNIKDEIANTIPSSSTKYTAASNKASNIQVYMNI